MSKERASVVFFSGDANEGNVSKVDQLLGHCVRNICGVGDKVYGITRDFIFDIDKNKQIPLGNVVHISAGRTHVVAISENGGLYSWGTGENGELGHGSCHREIKEPKKIKHEASFVHVSCGNNHTAAVDSKGNMYTWGENFDRQLGLYRKTESKLPPDSKSHLENVMMVPKFVPFSLTNSVKFVACGSRFTVAITSSGELWSWGAGECGQLGTGRCTYRDIPACCISKDMFNETFVDVACGYGHVVANTLSGKLYSWGLNAKGQLGMGDIVSRKHPELVEGASDVVMVYADGHSSACINNSGELLTWGSGQHYRLMNNDCSRNVLSPTMVTTMEGSVIEKFTFSATKSLALVMTKALSLNPESGPQKFRSDLEVNGCGFWASDTIVVKFLLNTEDDTAMPRSCVGKFARENVIACRPPKLAELGVYSVTVSMNGIDFLDEVLTLEVCPDPVCLSILSPTLVNARVDTDYHADVIIEASQLGKSCATDGVFVRLEDVVDDTKEALIVKGYVETAEEKEARLHNQKKGSISPNDEPDSGVVRVICKGVDMSSLYAIQKEKYAAISAQVSNTGIGFSEPSPERCVAHYFHVFDIEPQCCPTSGQREILVHGTSIPPSSLKIEAVVGLSQGMVKGVEKFLELKIPTRTDDDEKLCFTIPPVDDIFKKNKKAVPDDTDFYCAQIGFRLSDGKPLQEKAFEFNYYREQPIDVYPRAIRASGGTKLSITSSYIQFVSDEAEISFIERNNVVEKSVKFSEFKELEGETLCYSIECEAPCLIPDDEESRTDNDDRNPVDKVYIGLLLDGISRPIDSYLFEAEIFEEVYIETPIAKGPSVVGSLITARAMGLVDSDVCIIRIRSPASEEYIDFDGEIGEELDTLVFTLPEEVRELFPGDNSKSGSYFIDVSIDGSTFDEMESPGFLIKHT